MSLFKNKVVNVVNVVREVSSSYIQKKNIESIGHLNQINLLTTPVLFHILSELFSIVSERWALGETPLPFFPFINSSEFLKSQLGVRPYIQLLHTPTR